MFGARLDDAFSYLTALELSNPGPGEASISMRAKIEFDWDDKVYVGVSKATLKTRCAMFSDIGISSAHLVSPICLVWTWPCSLF